MPESKDPVASRKGAGSGIDILNGNNSTPKTRENQDEFVAVRKPERRVGDQPYWLIGAQLRETNGGTTTQIETYVSLCAKCGAPFLISVAGWPYQNSHVNRRCPEHRRPGSKIKRFEVCWSVNGGAA